MSGEGGGLGYNPADYGYDPADYGYVAQAQPVHVNPYAYGADDAAANAYGGNYVVNRASVASGTNSAGGGSRRKSRHSDNDDAASDIEMEPQGSAAADDIPYHLKNQTSAVELGSAREIFKTDRENRDGTTPSQGLSWLCIIFGLVFLFMIVVMLCFTANLMVIVGVFGDEGERDWNYGWSSSIIDSGDFDDFVDTYTSRVAHDAGNLVLITVAFSVLCVFIGLLLLCVRYSSNLPLYSTFCCDCIRIPHRAFIYTIFNTIECFTRRITIMYLILGIYGLVEMTYYVSYNCNSGECYAYIYPSFGWSILLITTLMISLCGFTQTRKLDPKLDIDTLDKYYTLEHLHKAHSHNNKIDLKLLLRSLSNQRKIILNCIMLLCLSQSGLLITAFSSEDTAQSVEVVVVQPHGWNVKNTFGKDWPDDEAIDRFGSDMNTLLNDNTKAQTWFNYGQTLRDLYILRIVLSIFSLIYLYFVLNKFKSFGVIKWIYFIIELLTMFGWIFVTSMYYYSYYDFYENGDGKEYIYTGSFGELTGKGISIGWGELVQILVFVYQAVNVNYAFKGL